MSINDWIAQTTRDVRASSISGKPGIAAVARRTYDAGIEEVWDAITTPERIQRWFLPLSGDLQQGGKFQLEGHAGGQILECDRPRKLHLEWRFEDHPYQEVVVTLTPDGDDKTKLELEHTGPGEGGDGIGHVLAVGVGWDPALVSFGKFVIGEEMDKQFWFESPEALEFTKLSVKAWAAALDESKVAPSDQIAKAAEETLKFYTPE
ncbi:SRPBCC domain-containing protein [Saccharopolyspora sp. NPDC000359]|uniref:SRPBCC domain-containing protein n=1 Tax=Saccharopolyspora sp. NPDC000359 TaxID=3154251 RepID=UPI00332117FE